jgi:putative PIN family toxin of toxin-antitoxin system
MKVVIDTNCLILSVPPKNEEFWLYLSFKAKAFEWVISNEILSEYFEQLTNFYSESTAILITQILLSSENVTLQEPFYKWNLIENDPDDNKFVDLAIACGADYLITEDKHFQPLKKLEFPKLQIRRLSEFKKIITP